MKSSQKNLKWNQGKFFLLDFAKYRPESNQILLRFRNGDAFNISCMTMWQNRRGMPRWNRLRIDPETHGALLIPTAAGDLEEVPGDVLRMLTNANYRAYVVRLASRWATHIGQHLAALRKARGLTQQAVADAAGLGRVSLTKVETGKVEPSFATVVKLLAAMGARLQDLPDLKAS